MAKRAKAQAVRWLLAVACSLGFFCSAFAAQPVQQVNDAAALAQLQKISANMETARGVLQSHDEYLSRISANIITLNKDIETLNKMIQTQGAEINTLTDSVSAVIFLLNSTATVLSILWGAFTWRLVILAKNQRDIW